MARILIIDDGKSFREALAESVRDFGHEVVEASGAQEALKLINEVDAAFLDLKMPGTSGIEFLREAKPLAPVIVLTAFADSSNTIEAIRLGAFDHLTKPIGRDDLQRALTEALKKSPIAPGGKFLRSGDDLIGFSPGMREVQKRIGIAASGEVTVLIEGETGTGKELVARAIHRLEIARMVLSLRSTVRPSHKSYSKASSSGMPKAPSVEHSKLAPGSSRSRQRKHPAPLWSGRKPTGSQNLRV
jgi:DNA-binding NtrC family response regulator